MKIELVMIALSNAIFFLLGAVTWIIADLLREAYRRKK